MTTDDKLKTTLTKKQLMEIITDHVTSTGYSSYVEFLTLRGWDKSRFESQCVKLYGHCASEDEVLNCL